MRRQTFGLLLMLALTHAVPVAATSGPTPSYLPPKAAELKRQEMDLNGDGLPEQIIAYTMPREGLPPTEGRALVLERSPAGAVRKFDLEGSWPGHYPPHFMAADLTKDGRPELVERVAGGGAWQMLRIFSRGADGYKLLLFDTGLNSELWDADGDGWLEVITRKRLRNLEDQALQRYIWNGSRFVAWHAPEWSYLDVAGEGGRVPRLKGMTLEGASGELGKAGLHLGLIALLDKGTPAGRVIRQSQPLGKLLPREKQQVHVALSAGDVHFTAPSLPQFDEIFLASDTGPGMPSVATGPEQLLAWRSWAGALVRGARQVVWTRHFRQPTYIIALARPWRVSLGGKAETIRWLGVGLKPPHRGLIYLASEAPRRGETWPRFKAALYTTTPIEPVPLPEPQSLSDYLRRRRPTDAFITLWPENWPDAVRHRSIRPEGWPQPTKLPPLAGARTPDPRFIPIPDHVLVTVLNGQVRGARRQNATIRVDVRPAPGRAQRWVLPLTGFNRSTQLVTVNLHLPDGRVRTRVIPLQEWADCEGNPRPESACEQR